MAAERMFRERARGRRQPSSCEATPQCGDDRMCRGCGHRGGSGDRRVLHHGENGQSGGIGRRCAWADAFGGIRLHRFLWALDKWRSFGDEHRVGMRLGDCGIGSVPVRRGVLRYRSRHPRILHIQQRCRHVQYHAVPSIGHRQGWPACHCQPARDDNGVLGGTSRRFHLESLGNAPPRATRQRVPSTSRRHAGGRAGPKWCETVGQLSIRSHEAW
jgi:hypothetical protein